MIRNVVAAALLASACGASSPTGPLPDAPTSDAAVPAEPRDLTVAFDGTGVPVSYLYRLGVQLAGHVGGAASAFGAEQRLGTLRWSPWWYVREASSQADALARIAASGKIDSLAALVSAGGEVVLGLYFMPPFLSSCPQETGPLSKDASLFGFNVCPPTNLDAWSDYVQAIVHYVSVERGLKVSYEVWNEPDLFYWTGTRAQFFETYRAAVRGARRADPTARVGGPSISDLSAEVTGWPITTGWLHEFASWCASHPIPEIGAARTPIDFLVWHRYGMTADWGRAEIETARGELTSAGYAADTALLIDEWNVNLERKHAWSDSEIGAAFAVSRVITWRQLGLTRQAYAAMGDYDQNPPEFHGGQGLVTESGIKKPVYNAFRLLGMMQGNEGKITGAAPSPFITATAAANGDGATLVLANAVPDLSMGIGVAELETLAELRTPGAWSARTQLAGVTGQQYVDLLAGRLDPGALGLSPEAELALRAGIERGKQIITWRARDVDMTIAVDDLDPAWSERRALVGPHASNAYSSYRDAVAAGSSETSALAAARAAQDLQIASTSGPIGKRNVILKLTLPPNSVMGIVWR